VRARARYTPQCSITDVAYATSCAVSYETGRFLRYFSNPKVDEVFAPREGAFPQTLRLAAWAAVKHVVDEDITFRAKVVIAILTPITIERAHSFANVRRRSGPERQRARVTIGA
jgi:hypothetical protein